MKRKSIWNCWIKNADDLENPQVRTQYGVLASVFGILGNVVLFAGKLIAGMISGSIAVMADAFNNLSDAGSSLVTMIGFRMAGKPADREHPFGHGRIEYISGLVVSFVILMVGFELFSGAIEKIFSPSELNSSALTVGILIASVLGKLGMGLLFRVIGKKIQSPSLMATMTDCISDAISTTAVLVSILIGQQFGVNLDGWFGAAVAILVFVAGLKTLKSTMDPLLGQAPDAELVQELQKQVLLYDGILGVHDLMVHNYGPKQFLASLHAEVSVESDMRVCHDLIDRIEKEVGEKLGVRLVIHMDPIETENERVNECRRMVSRILRSIDPSLTMHDFRMVDGPSHTNLIFDVLVPFRVQEKREVLQQKIQEEVWKEDRRYFTVVTFDTSFIGEE